MKLASCAWFLAPLAILAISCSVSHNTYVRDALVRGDQAVVDKFTESALQTGLRVSRIELMDERAVASDVVIRLEYQPQAEVELGISVVADYFLCLLGALHQVSGQEILGKENCMVASQCDPCNSQVFPLSPGQRNTLRRFWTLRLTERP
jgi:hypothetical protein